ncbi:HAD hydrolase-like protein [Bengtsoniella intestinalis]|uniref:HAD hydrolase-like protein n=1 Tax=Bengtsoniella intestinalis TaxID=3073143 RepID=UPI00391F4D83
MNDGQIDQAMELFRERYTAIGKFENTPAPGMLTLCQHLHEQGYQLALASSKPEEMCRDICEKFGFTAYLDVVAGAPLSEHSTKAEVIMDALSRLGVQGNCLDTVLMVGDRKFDVLGAKDCGIHSVGVEFFGYADENELMDAGALAVFDTAEAVEQWILEH